MSKGILIFVGLGILAGCFLIPNIAIGQEILAVSSSLITISICSLLLIVGFELGRDDTVREKVRKVGVRVFVFPFAAIFGTYVFTAIASVALPIGPREAMAAGGGFGWYSLAPNILIAHSARLSAICFLQNVMRELFGIVLIPFVAKRVGYIEATALPGVSVMDVCLPIIEKSASNDIVIYAIIMGLAMALAVPCVGIIAGI